jgi:hypothetical protein
MFSELTNEQLNTLYATVVEAKRKASTENDEIQWKALFSIEGDINSEMRERAKVVKEELLAALLPREEGDR